MVASHVPIYAKLSPLARETREQERERECGVPHSFWLQLLHHNTGKMFVEFPHFFFNCVDNIHINSPL